MDAVQMSNDPHGFLTRQDRGQSFQPVSSHHIVDPRQLDIHDAFVQKEESGQGLALRCGRDLTSVRQVSQECGNFRSPHIARMAFLVEQDEPANPVDISFLGPIAVVPQANCGPDRVQQAR